jgi:drug/metabolite transporter (DMT)-like permease
VHRYGAIKATTLVMLAGTPILVLVSSPTLLSQNWRGVRLVSWGGVLFSAFFAIALAYVVWSHGIHKIGSTRTSAYANVTPISTVLVAWPALGEVPLPGQILGAAIILTGLYMVRRGITHQPEHEGPTGGAAADLISDESEDVEAIPPE